jgi:hypothetical protein
MFYDFFEGYVECALWTATDEDGTPLDETHEVKDFSSSAFDEMHNDCREFYYANIFDVTKWANDHDAGVNFCLTRNRHGAGFWDRGKGDLGKRLTDASHGYGEFWVHEQNDGTLIL